MKLQLIESQLTRIPTEREAGKAKVAEIKAAKEAARLVVKELEVRSKGLELDMAQMEAQVVKFKNQQVQVKKNEEYQALTHEIEMAEKKSSDLEEREIELLYELDEAREKLGAAELVFDEQLKAEESHLGRIDEKQVNLEAEIDSSKAALEAARSNVKPELLGIYERVGRGIRFPIVVPLTQQKCGGCHMRVSSGVGSDVLACVKITTCDNCGRILYVEP